MFSTAQLNPGVRGLTKAQLTTILLYLRNAHTFTDSAHYIARSANDAETAKRLAALCRLQHEEILRIEDMRGGFLPEPAVS
jgi:hypothetical protein